MIVLANHLEDVAETNFFGVVPNQVLLFFGSLVPMAVAKAPKKEIKPTTIANPNQPVLVLVSPDVPEKVCEKKMINGKIKIGTPWAPNVEPKRPIVPNLARTFESTLSAGSIDQKEISLNE